MGKTICTLRARVPSDEDAGDLFVQPDDDGGGSSVMTVLRTSVVTASRQLRAAAAAAAGAAARGPSAATAAARRLHQRSAAFGAVCQRRQQQQLHPGSTPATAAAAGAARSRALSGKPSPAAAEAEQQSAADSSSAASASAKAREEKTSGASTAPASTPASDVDLEVRGAAPGEQPDSFDQAVGLERVELEDPDVFKHNEVIRGPFGTMEEPVLIESAFASRIVGCTGRATPEDHDLYWIEVKKDEKCSCPVCEQVFALKPAE